MAVIFHKMTLFAYRVTAVKKLSSPTAISSSYQNQSWTAVAGWDSSVGRASDFGCEVLASNLPLAAVPEATLGSHSSSSLTIPRCKIGTRPWPGKIRVDSEYTLCANDRESRQWCIHPGFKTHGWSQLKCKTESTSGFTKW